MAQTSLHGIRVFSLLLVCSLPFRADATGYYNLGRYWKGGINPYRLGADGVFQTGFTLGSGSISGSGDGMTNAPGGVTVDSSGNIYATDYGNSRIVKYNSSGAFVGWIGKIATSPTGGAAGCKGAAVGSFTPGWCTGGTSASGTGDGMLNNPDTVKVDAAGNLYVVDTSNHRVSKYSLSGAFLGWIGMYNSSSRPTGGAAGCTNPAINFTPGWCTGGQAFGGTNGLGGLYFPSYLALDSTGNIYVADSGNYRIVKYDSSGVFQGWIGKINYSPTGGAAGCNGAAVGTFTPGWCSGGGAQSGTGDGMLSSIGGLGLDAANNLYATTGSRVSKYNSSTGSFLGWIGKIATSPTGGASGCNGASVGTFTPGWCTGGTAGSGTGDGMLSGAGGIVFDSTGNIYISDNNHRISKYNSSGVFLGWIGNIATSPTGGATGCNGAAAGTFTPGWCKGGTSTSGVGDGMMNFPFDVTLDSVGNLYVADGHNNRINKYSSSGVTSGALQSKTQFFSWHRSESVSNSGSSDGMMNGPRGMSLDSSGNLYVADTNNHRISKYNSSGVFIGWIGKIATSPTGGASGCNGAAAGTFTPGWCKGGTSAAGTGDGMMDSPARVIVDASGNLFVSDSNNHRINKYDSSGAFQGWIGMISSSPTGGASGCSGAVVGTFTPGWCIGGAAGSGTGDGMMTSPAGMGMDSSSNLYVVDTGQNRVDKFSSSGAFQGWIGMIATSPTAGASGCAGASVSTVTPGWCKGGTSKTSNDGLGGLQSPQDVFVDLSGNIYVTNFGANIIDKYNFAGAFQGWIGKTASSPTGGASGCNGAAVGVFTPGWCTGGSGAAGTGDGMLSSPAGVIIDFRGNLYVTDSGNARINKYSSTGAFQGWIGKIATSPSGGGTGCNGAATGTFTQGWCKGGTSSTGNADGMMNGAYGLAVDSAGNLYVADSGNHRIHYYSTQGR